jgi:hypothetical protein
VLGSIGIATPTAYAAPVRRSLVLPIFAASALLAAPAPASAQARAADIAAALKANPVYADPQARPTLTPAQAEALRLRIAQRAPGRIAIAVVSAPAVRAAGGVRELAHGIDRDFDVNGALLVIDSENDSAWVIVSYDDPDRAVRAVRAAFAPRGGFVAHVQRAVDQLAVADPGPGTPAGGPQTPATTTPHTDVDVKHAVTTIFVVVLVIIGTIVALIVGIAVLGRRRRRSDPPAGGFQVAPPEPVAADLDAQRQAAEKAFGTDE